MQAQAYNFDMNKSDEDELLLARLSDKEMIKRKILVIAVTWLAFALIFFLGSVFAFNGIEHFRLAKRGTETKGSVISKEPNNHFFIRYSYKVGGQAYQGIGSAGRGNPRFEDLNVGDPVRVYYDPNNPTTSVLGDATQHLASISRGVVFATLLGPSFCLLGLYAKNWLPHFSKPGRH